MFIRGGFRGAPGVCLKVLPVRMGNGVKDKCDWRNGRLKQDKRPA